MVAATIPFSAFRVPDGKIAVTCDFHECDVFTGVIAVHDLEDLLKAFEEELELSAAKRQNVSIHVLLRRALKEIVVQSDPELRKGCMAISLWLSLNHPEHSNRMRAAVSKQLKAAGKAHLTIACDHRDMWGFSMSEKPVDLLDIADMLPTGSALSFFPDEADLPSH